MLKATNFTQMSARCMVSASLAPKQSLIGPAVRMLLDGYAIDAQSVKGTGPKGNVLKSDVLSHISQHKLTQRTTSETAHATPATALEQATPKESTLANKQRPISGMKEGSRSRRARYDDIPLSNMRRTIAKRLVESKSTIPHYYFTTEVEVDELLRFRKQLNDELAAEKRIDDAAAKPHKLSINDFVIKACALACLKIPSWSFDTNIRKDYVPIDISVAVSTDAGLITPIVKNADTKQVLRISKDIQELAAKGRAGKLKPDEYQGGTFTVSNLGMFGSVDHFTAIINPPQSCILAVGATKRRLVPHDNGSSAVSTMEVTLSSDRRDIDEVTAAAWLKHFDTLLRNPHTMLL